MAVVFVTGASGFMGRALSAELIRRGHRVRGLVREGGGARVAAGCDLVAGDPLSAPGYRDAVRGADTLVHLVGVSHPNPSKAAAFRTIDLASAREAVSAAGHAGVRHFLYVSAAHPAPVMREYIAARVGAEDAIRATKLYATILRPWYVLGPGRRWPLVLKPAYLLLEALPATRATARRLGLVTLAEMVKTMALALEKPASGVRIVEVPDIRASRLESCPGADPR
jgi:uncharacterized protein YbjT (DUF2867 family)